MENRDAFLSNLARRLGREPRQTPPPLPPLENDPART
ncbi:lactate utilization protein C, partial [Dickeya dianthicola]|nr:lactate utilization protein C [Dickeya dianthicola]